MNNEIENNDQREARVAICPDDDARLDLRVLVAGDNLIGLRIVTRLLERMGCSVEVMTDGDSAVLARERGEHDLWLVDDPMPGRDGLSVVEIVRQIEAERELSQIPILAMTDGALDADRDQPVRSLSGVDGVVTRPFNLRTLHASLSACVGGGSDRVGENLAESFDFDGLIERCGGDRQFVVDLIGTCLETFPESLRGMDEAMLSGDFRRLAVEAHGLKGVARTIGAEALAESCLALEKLSGLEDLEGSRKIMGRIVSGWEGLRSVFESYSKGCL